MANKKQVLKDEQARRQKQSKRDKRVQSKQMIPTAPQTQRIKKQMKQDNSIIVSNEEYIGDIVGTQGNFKLSFDKTINPCNYDMFKWLGSIGSRYEQYSFQNLQFVYKPLVGTQEPGRVVVGIDYNALDAPPTDMQTLIMYQDSVEANSWDQVTFKSRTDKVVRYNFGGSDVSTQDLKTYCLGRLFVGCGGQSANKIIGSLRVRYTVKLMNANLTTLPNLSARVDSNCSQSNPFNQLTFKKSNFGFDIKDATTAILKASGKFFLEVYRGSAGSTGWTQPAMDIIQTFTDGAQKTISPARIVKSAGISLSNYLIDSPGYCELLFSSTTDSPVNQSATFASYNTSY